jgi:hypothetical protein
MFLNFNGLLAAHEVSVILVSNNAFEFSGQDVSAKDISENFRSKIIDKLKDEIPDFAEEQVEKLHFIISGVSIEAIHSFMHGEAMQLFNSRFGEGHGYNVHSWVRLLGSEITRKNDYASDKIKSVEDLISKKCVARKVVEDSLELLSSNRRSSPDMALVNDELKASGWSPQDLMRMAKRIPQAVSDFTDSTNVESGKFVQRLEEIFLAQSVAPNLPQFIADAGQELQASLHAPYDLAYLRALSVVVYYEKI